MCLSLRHLTLLKLVVPALEQEREEIQRLLPSLTTQGSCPSFGGVCCFSGCYWLRQENKSQLPYGFVSVGSSRGTSRGCWRQEIQLSSVCAGWPQHMGDGMQASTQVASLPSRSQLCHLYPVSSSLLRESKGWPTSSAAKPENHRWSPIMQASPSLWRDFHLAHLRFEDQEVLSHLPMWYDERTWTSLRMTALCPGTPLPIVTWRVGAVLIVLLVGSSQ